MKSFVAALLATAVFANNHTAANTTNSTSSNNSTSTNTASKNTTNTTSDSSLLSKVSDAIDKATNAAAWLAWEDGDLGSKPKDVVTDTVSLANTLADATKSSFKADLVYHWSPSAAVGYKHFAGVIAGGANANWAVGS
jgi:hypothetical protein